MSRIRLTAWTVAASSVVTLALTGASPLVATSSAQWREANTLSGEPPIVIAHRGASAYRPEHTLAAYELAIDLGADYIEPDVVSTKDGELVARHENEISGTTDVADHPEFADRKATKTIDGQPLTGWFTEDFTLAELRTLRAKERLPELRPDNTAFDGLYEIPTLQEVIGLAARRGVGIYPETKHPTYFDGIGLSLEEPLVAALERGGLRGEDAPVIIQSFETGNLRELDRLTDVPLAQLVGSSTQAPYDLTAGGDKRTYSDLVTRGGLRAIARYADGIGPDKSQILPRDATGRLTEPTSLILRAHRAGLVVHPYTVRPENSFLPTNFRRGNPASAFFQGATGDVAAELRLLYVLGADGVFADAPDSAVAVREQLFSEDEYER